MTDGHLAAWVLDTAWALDTGGEEIWFLHVDHDGAGS